MYVTKFTVRGKGSFPADMLRYDRCYPASPQDVDMIFVDAGDPEVFDWNRNVSLFTRHNSKNDANLSGDRWRSFLWPVIRVDTPRRI